MLTNGMVLVLQTAFLVASNDSNATDSVNRQIVLPALESHNLSHISHALSNSTSDETASKFFKPLSTSTPDENVATTPRLMLDAVTEVIALKRCYDHVGCFSIGPPWMSLSRPINLFPQSPQEIKPTYCLFTREMKLNCKLILWNDPVSVANSNAVKGRPTFFITHGYLETGFKIWVKRLKNELLHHGDYNVIIVDWAGGSGPPYTQAVANTRVVGATTAHLILIMKMELFIQPEKCHVIGHSLGAHLSGYVGRRLRYLRFRLGRITGLDPAEPHFANTDPEVRLDPSDALFVDVIHTDAGPFLSGGLGLMEPVGHMDFYPNGGVLQPGCGNGVLDSISKEDGSLILGLRRFLGCNHVRAHEFFTESINSQCPFSAVECPSWEDFVTGRCFDCPQPYSSVVQNYSMSMSAVGFRTCPVLGFHSPKYFTRDKYRGGNKTYYLMTGPYRPYCRYHFRVTVKVADNLESRSHGGDGGFLFVSFRGQRGSTTRLRLNEKEVYFEPGLAYRFVVGAENVGDIIGAMMDWEYYSTLLNPLTWRILSKPKIYLDRVTIECLETQYRVELCGPVIPMLSRQPRELIECKTRFARELETNESEIGDDSKSGE